MTLSTFLLDHAPLTAVDLLPDLRLINVVIGDGALYGVVVADIPIDATVTRAPATLDAGTITTSAGLVFATALYVMLSPDDVAA